MGTDVDHTQSASMPDGVEAGLFAGPGVGEDFSDLEPRESSPEVGKVVGEEGWVATGGWAKGSRQDPIGGQQVVQELTSVAVVAIDHSLGRRKLSLLSDGSVGACSGWFFCV